MLMQTNGPQIMVIKILAVATLVCFGESARILSIFPLPARSHHFIFRAIMEGLAKNGHEIVYVTPIPYEKVPDGIKQIDLSHHPFLGITDDVMFGEKNLLELAKSMSDFGVQVADSYLGTPEVQELIHSNESFDAVMFESYFTQEYLTALTHKFNAIGIEINSLGDYSWGNELAGLSDNPAYQLDFQSEVKGISTLWERLYNTYSTFVTTLGGYYSLYYAKAQIMDRYFNYTGWEARPPIEVMCRNRSLVLINAHNILGYPFPTAPHVRTIGGINIKPNKPLPQDLQTFLDESENGVIYMSLGSLVNTNGLSKEFWPTFMETFKQLPQKVLVKINNYTEKTPSNVKVSSWYPQQDILAHENCVLFITHGGLLSMSEAVYHEIPLIGIPFFGDQPKNVIFVENAGFGRLLRRNNITNETVSWTINEVLSNPRYKIEISTRSKILRDIRHTPSEEATYWIEHTLKYPFALTPKSAGLTAFQLHMLDIIIFIVLVIVATLISLLEIVYYIIKKFSTSKPKVKTN